MAINFRIGYTRIKDFQKGLGYDIIDDRYDNVKQIHIIYCSYFYKAEYEARFEEMKKLVNIDVSKYPQIDPSKKLYIKRAKSYLEWFEKNRHKKFILLKPNELSASLLIDYSLDITPNTVLYNSNNNNIVFLNELSLFEIPKDLSVSKYREWVKNIVRQTTNTPIEPIIQ